MFNDTMLDSSPWCAPVLARRHYVIALASASTGFLAALRLLPLLFVSSRGPVLAAQSSVAGVTLMFYTLMLCYVHADAGRLGLRAWAWTSLVLLTNLFGFVLYSSYSAARTHNWKRVTMPVAYLLEMALIGTLLLIPLIYTAALPRATLSGMILAPPAPPAPALPRGSTAMRSIRRISQRELLTAPVKVPRIIAVIRDQPEVAPEAPGGGNWPCSRQYFRRNGLGPLRNRADRSTTAPSAGSEYDEAKTDSNSCGRAGGSRQAYLPGQARVSSPGEDGSHPGSCPLGGRDQHRRNYSELESFCRAPLAGEGGNRRCRALALPAYTFER